MLGHIPDMRRPKESSWLLSYASSLAVVATGRSLTHSVSPVLGALVGKKGQRREVAT